jgi:hypothetical protein
MGTSGPDVRRAAGRVDGPTPADVWHAAAGTSISDELLEWPPDVFALTNVVLGRSEAFRFALSPVGEWPPGRIPDWAGAVEEAGRARGAWVEDHLDLHDRVLVAARREVNSIDVVLLPESAVDESEIDDLEALLYRHGVVTLQTGVRQRAAQSGQLPGNWIHMGVNPRLEKGGALPTADGEPWFHIRQNKHHRWSLDENQIYQYHLGGVLHPQIRWWEAMEVPRMSLQFVEVAELTLVCLVCEDLAQNDDLAQLIRSVDPTCVIAALLDGPQLASRWAGRYASVLADDPGSAVLTLTSFGMVQRSRPHGRNASAVIALWKDPTRVSARFRSRPARTESFSLSA